MKFKMKILFEMFVDSHINISCVHTYYLKLLKILKNDANYLAEKA